MIDDVLRAHGFSAKFVVALYLARGDAQFAKYCSGRAAFPWLSDS